MFYYSLIYSLQSLARSIDQIIFTIFGLPDIWFFVIVGAVALVLGGMVRYVTDRNGERATSELGKGGGTSETQGSVQGMEGNENELLENDEAIDSDDEDTSHLEEQVQIGLSRSQDSLEDELYENAVNRSYQLVRQFLAEELDIPNHGTPREFYEACLENEFEDADGSLDTLTEYYESVVFGSDSATEDMATKSIDLAESITHQFSD